MGELDAAVGRVSDCAAESGWMRKDGHRQADSGSRQTRRAQLGALRAHRRSRHCGNFRGRVVIFLEEHQLSLAVFQHMGPFVLADLARLLHPPRRRAQDNDGIALLDYYARRKFAEVNILSDLREEPAISCLPLKRPAQGNLSLGPGVIQVQPSSIRSLMMVAMSPVWKSS
jgi:hypothetical protein